MKYFSLDDLKQFAFEAGYVSNNEPYSEKDDTALKAYLTFVCQIKQDFNKIKFACLTGNKSALDPNVSFEFAKAPRIGSYMQVICKVRPGLMLGKTETISISSSKSLYTFDGEKYTALPSDVELNYGFDCQLAISCMVEDNSAISLSLSSEHLNEKMNVAEFKPYKPVYTGHSGGNSNEPTPPVDKNSVIGLCQLGTAITL